MMKYETRSETDTLSFAREVAGMLAEGDTVLLTGGLGAGKSVFARGVARGLGVAGPMPSPTFTLLIPHQGDKKVYHFDLYRLADPDEFYEAGLDEFIGGDGVALVEWPQMAELEARPSLDVRIERGDGDDARVFTLENQGVRGFEPKKLSRWRLQN